MVWKFKESGNSRWRGNSRKEEIQDSVEIQRKRKSKIAWKFKESGNSRWRGNSKKVEIQDSAEIHRTGNPR